MSAAVRAAALSVLLLLVGVAPAGAQNIPPGEEALLARMLGHGTPLPHGCKFADGQVERDVVRATYDCTGGEVRIQLSHPSAQRGEAIVTRQFALTVVAGTPPEELLHAIEASIRAHESEFAWSMLAVGTSNRGVGTVLGLPVWVFALALLAMAVAAWASAARDWPARWSVDRLAALEGLVVAATVLVWLQIDAEPPAHGDTAVDVALARDCLASDWAFCSGHAASAIGLVQGQAFTFALAAWLRLGWSMRELCFVAACVVAAATGLLHYATARRFGGAAWLASALASTLAVSMTGYPALWNPSWFVLPLTVAFLATLAIANGRGTWSAFVAGVALAVTTESHVLFGTVAAVAALIALITAPRPIVATTALLASFVLTSIVISPLSSTVNAIVLREWTSAHPAPVALVTLLAAVSVPLQLWVRRAVRADPARGEAVAVLVWLLTGAVAVGMILPWAVSRPPQVRYYGAAFPALGYAAAWLVNAATSRVRSSARRVAAMLIFAAIFAHRIGTADFAGPGWFMDEGREVATAAGLDGTAALDVMLVLRPLPDSALRDVAAAFAGTAAVPQFPPRIVRAVRAPSHGEPPDGWQRVPVARGAILTSDIDAWTRPEAANVCPDPANGDPCLRLTRADFDDVARGAGGLLHRVFGLRIARAASRIGEWTARGTRSLTWTIPLQASGPDATREILFPETTGERIVGVDGTSWRAGSGSHVTIDRPAPGVAASITVRTPVDGKFEAGLPPLPVELRAGEVDFLRDRAGK